VPDPTGGLLGPLLQGQSLVHGIIPQGVPLGAGAAPLVPPPGFGTTLPSTAVSTRYPTGAGREADPLRTPLMSGDVKAFLAQENAPYNVGLLGSYPGMSFLKGMPHDETFHAAARRMSENLTYLFERSPKIMQEASPQWYIGANRMVNAWAKRWGVPQQSAAAGAATLSPSKDWYMNASMAERVGDILFGKSKMPFSSSMLAKAKEITADGKNAEIKTLLPSIRGKRLADLSTPEQKAAWIRLYDEAHQSSDFRLIAPDGGLGPFMINKDGTRTVMTWQSNENVAKSVRALESGGDMDKISPLLGQMHKVRNFYNNLTHPDKMIGVTSDTHHVAGSLLAPLGGSDIPTKHAMPGTPLSAEDRARGETAAKGSSVTGFKGTYPVFEEAGRLAGQSLGLLPHMAQSATWEPARQLFVNKSAGQKQLANEIWRGVDQGLLTPAQARDMVFEQAGGIRLPQWATTGLLQHPEFASTYRK
jgi:hypothetical protein